jgi:phospholipase C
VSTGRPSRRRFLQGAGAVVGASVLGAGLDGFGSAEQTFAAARVAASGLSGIEHVVVLMLENRSFDNVIGWLYDPANAPPFDVVPGGQTYDGLSGKVLSNPVPAALGGGTASPGTETVTWYPDPDPGEVFADVYEQLFDTDTVGDPNRSDVPGMQGFVDNYARTIAHHNQLFPPGTDPRIIMNGFRPPTIPALSSLAHGYAVCDQWFSSIPTQTFCNRSFVHAGTSSGYVNNLWKTGSAPWDVGVFLNQTPTIFNLLEANRTRWRIYHAGSLAFCMAFLTQHSLTQYATIDSATNRFFPLQQFYADAAATGTGGLPSYSFIEPNFVSSHKYGPENDGHPNPPYNIFASPSNLLWADKLVGDVYAALSQSPNWERTLLMITFDEHGGCYDHVPPSPTVSPDGVMIPANEPGGSGFAFGRLGLRVPTILVSPRIDAGRVVHTPFDHTSIIKTVINAFDVRDGFGQPATLLAREAAANDVSEALTLDTPRTDTVAIPPIAPPPFDPDVERPLTPFQSDIVAAAAALLERSGAPLPYHWTDLGTTEQATAELDGRVEALRNRAPAVPTEPKFTG